MTDAAYQASYGWLEGDFPGEFQWREEDLNALVRGPEPRVLAATLSRNNRPRGPKPIGSALFLHGAE